MGGEDHSSFFDVINKLIEHSFRFEPRITEVEWKVRIMWWVVISIGALAGSMVVLLAGEWLKKFVFG